MLHGKFSRQVHVLMSEIDQLNHKCLGFIRCPSSYEIIFSNASIKEIPVYLLKDSSEIWNAKCGDVLVGGGRGESAALRISIPENIFFFIHADWDDFEEIDDLFKAFWSPTEAFAFGDGYRKVGWNVSQSMESWVTEQVVAFLISAYPERYLKYVGDEKMELNNHICRLAP